MSGELLLLSATAASIGFVHALAGPDHYLPFVALARARRWSLPRTAGITAACGLAHVAGSLALAGLAVAVGGSLGGLARIEPWRGAAASWLLIGFGLAYLAWAVRQMRRRPAHSHWHAHADGTVHRHQHDHRGEHAHLHPAPATATGVFRRITPWALFLIFVLGPCEPLVPLLLLPAATYDWLGVGLIAAAFAAATVTTMTLVVAAGRLGAARLPDGSWQRWSHAAAGLVLVACGLAVRAGL